MTIDGAAYTLDNAGNRTAKTDQRTAVATSYGYDSIYQLLSATQGATTTESYAYDAVGNRTSSLGVASYTTNSSNELTANSNASFTYDNNGNELTKVDSTGTTTYAWDFENRMTSVTLPGSGGTVSFKYDPFGRRIYKSSSAGTSIYAYDRSNIIEETDSSGAAVARYVQSGLIDEPLAMLRSSSTSYYEADGLGSVTSLSNAAGTLAQTYTFDSFGKQTASSGSLVNSFQYTARESDSETGLYFYRARYYDPQSGRFLREDPLRFGSGDPNFYSYVSQNPTNYTDPLGKTRIYGNWCGPNWTGGLVESFDPRHVKDYKKPIDKIDEVCQRHDICYFNCRKGQPCDPDARLNCFKNCDQVFVQEMPDKEKFWPTVLDSGINLHRIFGSNPEDNAPGCCKPKAPPQPKPCGGFSCLDNR